MADYLFQVDKLKRMANVTTKNVDHIIVNNSHNTFKNNMLCAFLASGQLRVSSLMRLLLVNAIRNSKKNGCLDTLQSTNTNTNTNTKINTK